MHIIQEKKRKKNIIQDKTIQCYSSNKLEETLIESCVSQDFHCIACFATIENKLPGTVAKGRRTIDKPLIFFGQGLCAILSLPTNPFSLEIYYI